MVNRINEGASMKCRPARRACFIVLLVFIVLLLPLRAQVHATGGSDTLVTMFKEVVLGAAQWGIEEAGVRVMGPSGWKLAKVVLKPAMDVLQSQYPALFDTKAAGTPQAQTASIEAAAWVQQNRQFQASITEQFTRLEQAQRDQLAMLIEMKQASEAQRRLLVKLQQSIDRVERRIVVQSQTATQTVFRPETPGSPTALTENWYMRARKTKDPNEKLRLYSEAIRFNQNTLNAYFERGLAYFDLKDFNSARADFDRTIVLNGSWASAYTNRGAASQQLSRFDDAIADFKASIRLDPSIPENYQNLEDIYAGWKNYAAAYAVAKLRLQNAAPADQAVAYGSAGWWGLLARDFSTALAYTQKALEISQDEKWIHTTLAHGYLFNGQFAKALEIYLKYTGIKIAKLYWEEVILNDFKDLEGAGAWHPRMNELRVGLYGNLSYNLLFERRFEESAKYARMGLALDPNAIWINSNLAHSLLFTNQPLQASSIYQGYAGWTTLGKRWEQIILDDFDELKVAGIMAPGMDLISARMAASLRGLPSR